MTPVLKGKSSVSDLIFEMSDEEDEEEETAERIHPPQFTQALIGQSSSQTPLGSPEVPWSDVRRRRRSSSHAIGSQDNVSTQSPIPATLTSLQEVRPPGRPWGVTPLTSTKLDLKDIMSQASVDKPSNLTLGFSQAKETKPSGSFHSKMSQKERKRQQQAQQLGQPATIEKPQPAPPAVSPWQAMSHKKQTPSSSPVVAPAPPPSRTPSTPQLTMRQTIANNGTTSKQKSEQTPTQFSGSVPAGGQSTQNRPSSASGPGMSVSTTPIRAPHSVRHIPLPSHSPTSPSQHLSMTEILSLQQAEKDFVKDAAAKRSLQEIQQEQEFQEWWDQESKRVMLEEEQRKRAEERAAKATRGRGKGRGGRGKGKGKDKKEVEEDDRGKGSRDVGGTPSAQESSSKPAPKEDNSERNKGRGRGHRGGRGGGGRGGKGQAKTKDTGATQPASSQEKSGAR